MKLLNDVARCIGVDCDIKERCERYLQRERYDRSTPFNLKMHKSDGECVGFIDKNERGMEWLGS